MKSNEERVRSIMKKAEMYKKKRGQVITSITVAVCMALIVGANYKFSKYKNNNNVQTDVPSNVSQVESFEGELVAFNSKEELVNKLEAKSKEYNERNRYVLYDYAVEDMAVAESAVAINTTGAAAKSANQESGLGAAGDSSYSETNVQTKGVDESDIIKTDGKRIYYMSGARKDVKVFEDVNDEIKLVKTIELGDSKADYYYGDSMFLDGKHLVVVGYVSRRIDAEKNDVDIEIYSTAKKIAYPYYRTKSYTQISIYDVNNYNLIRKVETEGNLVSSRKVGDDLYLVSNRYLYFYSFDKNDVIPLYRDTLTGDDYKEVGIESIRAFKGFEDEESCNYMIVTSLNLADDNSKLNVDTYLGAGSEIYCSTDNLYVTKPNYNYKYRTGLIDVVKNAITDDYEEPTSSTSIHKFAIKNGKATYVATGKVQGTLLNQFSMDEYDGKFRITTTDDNGNNLYVLDEKLQQIGKLENLAKGERIYSTRFMGDKAYVVTYKTVDPLFVIDLSNPYHPMVLGELKIPGYSSYLHPLGDHYLLGFGEDSVEKSYTNWEGEQEVVAYSSGLKMAIFDVSDYSHPKELYSVKIGGRGSYSELLYNHKALLLDEAKKIFAFPVSINKEAGYYEDGTPMYGDLEFAGALVYNIDVNSGFSLKGKITHEAEDRYSKYGNIERIIYIGNKFYTVSNGMIKSTDINTMKEVNSLKIERDNNY